MIEREMPKDIRKYEAKFFGPFTLREAICLAIAGICSLTLYNTIGKMIIPNIRGYICFGAAIPPIAFGWLEPYGMTLEKYLNVILRTMVLAPKKRKYKTQNMYDIKNPTKINSKKKKKKKIKHISGKPEFVAYK